MRLSSLFNLGCAKWKVRYGAAAKARIGASGHSRLRLRGVLCEVMEDGEVSVGDPLMAVR